MKTQLILALLAIAPALLASEPITSTPVETTTNAANGPAFQEDIADQAALVQQIGQEAARGFDAEAHAHALRLQMEALVAEPATANAPGRTEPVTEAAPSGRTAVKAPTTVLAPSVTVLMAGAAASPSRDTAIGVAIQKLKAALNELEIQLSANGKSRSE